jgi:hypothetical protein
MTAITSCIRISRSGMPWGVGRERSRVHLHLLGHVHDEPISVAAAKHTRLLGKGR